MQRVARFDRFNLSHADAKKSTPLGDGSLRVPARLTRVGVFDYGDHAEARLPEDVFAKPALDSFKGLVLTEGHPNFVTPENWREIAVGHVGDEHYDAIQRNIVGNHAALGPVDWGRAGPNVRVMLDERGASRDAVSDAAERMARRHVDAWKRRDEGLWQGEIWRNGQWDAVVRAGTRDQARTRLIELGLVSLEWRVREIG